VITTPPPKPCINDEVVYKAARWQVVLVRERVQKDLEHLDLRGPRLRLFRHATGEVVWADADEVVVAGE